MRQALKIDKIYRCKTCNSVFLFELDIEDHAQDTGHREILESSLD